MDEHSLGMVYIWARNLHYIYQYTIDTISEEHILAAFSLLGTIVFMLAVGYIIIYFVQFEDDKIVAKTQQICK